MRQSESPRRRRCVRAQMAHFRARAAAAGVLARPGPSKTDDRDAVSVFSARC
jgi:hypothetical protein